MIRLSEEIARQPTSKFAQAKMIVFDLDGTLIDTSIAVADAFQRVFEAALLNGEDVQIPSEELIWRTFGLLDEDIWSLLAPSMSTATKNYYMDIHENLIKEKLSRSSCALPGVAAMLARLQSRYTLATASNCGLTYMETVLHSAGIHSYFTYPMCAGSVNASEKADILRALIEAAGHDRMIMVGDRSTDIEAANSVGIPVIGVPSKFGKPDELRNADVVLQTILDLEKAIGFQA